MSEKKIYISYGSNLNLEQMSRRCPNAEIIGTAMLENYELEFRRVATIVPKEGARVPILLWQIDEYDEHNLDRYEGFPNSYRKEELEVEVNGSVVKGMAYVMNGGQAFLPSAEYYIGILEGYEDNRLDTEYLAEALKKTAIAMNASEDEPIEDEENSMRIE